MTYALFIAKIKYMKLLKVLFILNSLLASIVFAQNKSSIFKSEQDELLHVDKIFILPMNDNLDGIYAKPIEEELKLNIDKSHKFSLINKPEITTSFSLEDLENNPSEIQRIGSESNADAIIAAKAIQGPKGINIVLSMFLAKDGLLISQESLKDYPKFDIKSLKSQGQILLTKTLEKLPYHARVLSRIGERVTINLGIKDGIKVNSDLNVIQIINVKRHPKFNFLLGSDKVILGQLKVLKVEEHIAFANITFELEKNSIQVHSKIQNPIMLEYAKAPILADSATSNDLQNYPQAKNIFGEKAAQWLPSRPPTFGAAQLAFGLGNYSQNLSLGSNSYSSESSFYTHISLDTELWITPNYTLELGLQQGVLSLDNPRSGSKPSELNVSTTKWDLRMAYNFLMYDDFFGPKAQALIGFSSYDTYLDSSSPTSFTSTKYSGISLGLRASLPVDDKKLWDMGVEMFYYLSTKLNERPISSGQSSSNKINTYSFFGNYKYNNNIRFTGALDFELFSTNFSGAGDREAEDLSQKSTSFNVGLKYLF